MQQSVMYVGAAHRDTDSFESMGTKRGNQGFAYVMFRFVG